MKLYYVFYTNPFASGASTSYYMDRISAKDDADAQAAGRRLADNLRVKCPITVMVFPVESKVGIP